MRFSGFSKAEMLMRIRRYCLAGLVAALWATAFATLAADDGLITKPSRYSAADTIARFEAAIKQREKDGLMVFGEIDHAATARKFGLDMRPRTVILFGVPKIGTPLMIKTPLVAIDYSLKALVWEDDQGKVWLSYNSADYLFKTIYPRHGATAPPSSSPLASGLDGISDYATK
jgi:uncharacterized protein (DUF302 family)